jgi:hypothetical protein
MLACEVIRASARMLSKHIAGTLKKYLCLLKIVMTDKVSLVFGKFTLCNSSLYKYI